MTQQPNGNDSTQNFTAQLPQPTITVVPAKPGLPAAGGKLDLLVTVEVDLPAVDVDRKPLNLALVIDRSGSMSGPALQAAKAAAQTAVGMLVPGDWVSVVAFESGVTVVQPLVQVTNDRRAIVNAIEQVREGGSTNLFGGWAEGLSQALACPDPDVVTRVVLLSDGMANVGVTNPGAIAADVTQAAGHGVTTTSMGLGSHYDEHLLRMVADAGRGNYVFLSDHDVVVTAFQNEVAGLSSLRGRGLHLAATPAGSASLGFAAPDVAAASGLRLAAGGVNLPDLVAGLPIDLLVTLDVQPGAAEVGLTLSWNDVLTGRPEKVDQPLDLPRLSPEEWAAAEENDKVTLERLLLEIAATKRRVGEAARSRDLERAQLEIETAFKIVLQLPLGAERSREEAELAELKRRLARRDHEMTARYSSHFMMQKARSVSDEKMAFMREREAELRRMKFGAEMAGGGFSSAAGPATVSNLKNATDEVLLDLSVEGAGGPVRVQVVRGRIEEQGVDAIVNSGSRSLIMASGVTGAIARAGGPELRRAMQAAPRMQYGEAVFTHGFALPAQYVIHTAAQPYTGDGSSESVLKLCYNSVYTLAARLGAKSVALPAIGAGNYRFPPQVAAHAAEEVTGLWVRKLGQFQLVRFVVQERPTADAFVQAFMRWEGRRPVSS